MQKATPKPRLLGLPVPWMVCPSTAYLRLSWGEGAEPALVVEFVGYYKLFHTQSFHSQVSIGEEVQVVTEPNRFELRSDDDDVPYRMVRVVLDSAPFLKVEPRFSAYELIDENLYDWSGSSFYYQEGQSIDEYLERFTQEWLRTGICPNPGVYIVENSPWLKEFNFIEDEYRHLLFLANDSTVEVITRKWRWEEGQPIHGWS